MVGGEIETDTVNYMAHMVSGSCAVQSHAIQSLQAYYAFRGPLDRSELLLHTELDADWSVFLVCVSFSFLAIKRFIKSISSHQRSSEIVLQAIKLSSANICYMGCAWSRRSSLS
jgi:hypothetical protein